jgi:hypothetical protein
VPGLDAVTRICVQELAGRADVRDQRGGQQRRIAEVEAPAGAIEECPAAIVRV